MLLHWPWALAALPLPWLVRRLAPPAPPVGAALRVPFFTAVQGLAARPTRRWPAVALLAWALLVLAAAQPQWLRQPELIPTSGRDLMLVVDISGSMRAMDFGSDNDPLDRLAVVKRVAGDFLSRRTGDRLGLILFGGRPALRAPLTHDRATVRALLEEAEIGLAGEHTALGDAVGLALKTLRGHPADSRVIVLLTDGVSNAGSIGPRQAAGLAAKEGVRLYTVGMGSDESFAPNPLGAWSAKASRDFNREVLEDMARLTGGAYLHALDRAGLEDAYRRIDALEPGLGEELREYVALNLYLWPLAAALGLSVLLGVRASRPRAGP